MRALSWTVGSWLKSRERLRAENLALRHQLNTVCRSTSRRPRLRGSDRLLFVWLYRVWLGALASMAITRPETVVRWHRRGFKAFWRWKSRGSPGRPRIHGEVRGLSVGYGAKIPHSQSRRRLQRSIHAAGNSYGHPRSPYGAPIALAKRLCSTLDRFNSKRVPGSPHRLR